MGQSKGKALNSSASVYSNHEQKLKEADFEYQWSGSAAALLCPFHLRSLWFKNWLMDGRWILRKHRILEKKLHLIILIGNVKTNIFLDDISAKHYLSEQKHKSHLFLYAVDMLKISAWIITLFEETKNLSYLLITWYSLGKTVMRIFIIRQQKWEVILLVCWTEGIWCTLIYNFTLHWFNNTYFDIFYII